MASLIATEVKASGRDDAMLSFDFSSPFREICGRCGCGPDVSQGAVARVHEVHIVAIDLQSCSHAGTP